MVGRRAAGARAGCALRRLVVAPPGAAVERRSTTLSTIAHAHIIIKYMIVLSQ